MNVRRSKKTGRYEASDPDYPGIRGVGKTEESALKNLEDKIGDHERQLEEVALEFEPNLTWGD